MCRVVSFVFAFGMFGNLFKDRRAIFQMFAIHLLDLRKDVRFCIMLCRVVMFCVVLCCLVSFVLSFGIFGNPFKDRRAIFRFCDPKSR